MDGPNGRVEAIYLAAAHGEAPHSVERAIGHAGKGLEGDRNFGDPDPDSCDITLIEAEIFESQAAQHGLDLTPSEARRQVLVRGIDLGFSSAINEADRVGARASSRTEVSRVEIRICAVPADVTGGTTRPISETPRIRWHSRGASATGAGDCG